MNFEICIVECQQDAIEKRTACFNKLYSDYGTDTNMNGLYDIITTKIGINVFDSGDYNVSGSLYDPSGKEIINATNHAHLHFGAKSVLLEFYGSKSIGTHSLKNLSLYDSYGNLIDHIDDAYFTKSTYDLIEYGPLTRAKLTGNFSDYGIDEDRDGLYDYLNVNAEVDVNMPGEYSLMGYLNDLKNQRLVWAIDHRNLSTGNHTMNLGFNGRSLRKSKANGPYNLLNATLFSGSSYTGIYICDYLQEAYTTCSYNFSDFEI